MNQAELNWRPLKAISPAAFSNIVRTKSRHVLTLTPESLNIKCITVTLAIGISRRGYIINNC